MRNATFWHRTWNKTKVVNKLLRVGRTDCKSSLSSNLKKLNFNVYLFILTIYSMSVLLKAFQCRERWQREYPAQKKEQRIQQGSKSHCYAFQNSITLISLQKPKTEQNKYNCKISYSNLPYRQTYIGKWLLVYNIIDFYYIRNRKHVPCFYGVLV